MIGSGFRAGARRDSGLAHGILTPSFNHSWSKHGSDASSAKRIRVKGRSSAARRESALARTRSAARGAASGVEAAGFSVRIRKARVARELAQATSAAAWRARPATAFPRFATAVAGVAGGTRGAGAFTLGGAKSRPTRRRNGHEQGQFAGASHAQARKAIVRRPYEPDALLSAIVRSRSQCRQAAFSRMICFTA